MTIRDVIANLSKMNPDLVSHRMSITDKGIEFKERRMDIFFAVFLGSFMGCTACVILLVSLGKFIQSL